MRFAGEPVAAYVLHHEPTFDHDEIRRHMTVLALTPTRLILVHHDLPEPSRDPHGDGWAHYLARLASVAAGAPPEPDPWLVTE